jgi:hypothetical protein
VRVCFVAALVLAATTGCGVLRSSEVSPPVTDAALATMVVQEDELKQEFPVLERDGELGSVTAQEMADQTFDPDDTASGLKRAGWLRGYVMDYYNPHRIGPRLGLLICCTLRLGRGRARGRGEGGERRARPQRKDLWRRELSGSRAL